jgi:hypothetical protein
VNEVWAVFRSDRHELVVVVTESENVYLMTTEEYDEQLVNQ